MADLEGRFEAPQAAVRKLRDQPDNDTLLELYFYFKQATEGVVRVPWPGAFDFVPRAKYDAREARRGARKDTAMWGCFRLLT
jgi:diazepam-binding inhibitor (GABA receptor modulator, acyl-CoA-binding protein)